MIGFALGFVAGAVVIGFIANRRPQWFAGIVRLTNIVDDAVNTQIGKLK